MRVGQDATKPFSFNITGEVVAIMERESMVSGPSGLPEAGISEICRRYGVKELSVFGSAARGEMRSDSDIDLLVEFQPDAAVSLLDHLAAEREFSELFGRKVDLVSKRGLRPALRNEVLSQARVIYAS
jgi:predicted nucleotidyltransferase